MNPQNEDTPIFGRLGRRVSDATKFLVTGEVPQPKERSSSTSQPSSPAVFPSSRPFGKSRTFTSTITSNTIVESSASTKYFIEASHCTYDVVTCEIRIRETSENAHACLDTASSTSFISTYEARTKFHSSEIKTMSSPMEFGTGGGPMVAREYVVADLYLPISSRTSTLAKVTAILFLREGRLPNGSEILLGMDFLFAQRISILLPNMTAVIGACGNAEIRLLCFKNSDYPVRQNAPDLTASGRPPQTKKDVTDLVAESRKAFQGPPAPLHPVTRGPLAGLPQHRFGERNFFMITSPENTDKRKGEVISNEAATQFATGTDNLPSLMGGIPFWDANNTRPVGAPGKISAPVSAPRVSATINGQSHPLRSAPGPGLTKNPATAFLSHGFVPGHSVTESPPPAPPVSPVDCLNLSTATSSTPPLMIQTRPFTISDEAVLQKPRPIPDVASKSPEIGRNGSYLGKISRPGHISPSGSSSSSSGSDSTVRPSRPTEVSESSHPPSLDGITINPNTQPDAETATRIACEEEFSKKKF